jgi:hypothetical protein
MKAQPPLSPIANDRRRARRRQKLPDDAACALCGWKTPDALLRVGRNLLERDHVDGDANNPELVVLLCPNCHAVRTEAQRRLGVDLRHDDSRTVIERLEAAHRSRASFDRLRADSDLKSADRLAALTEALDRRYPGWRQVPEARP